MNIIPLLNSSKVPPGKPGPGQNRPQARLRCPGNPLRPSADNLFQQVIPKLAKIVAGTDPGRCILKPRRCFMHSPDKQEYPLSLTDIVI